MSTCITVRQSRLIIRLNVYMYIRQSGLIIRLNVYMYYCLTLTPFNEAEGLNVY